MTARTEIPVAAPGYPAVSFSIGVKAERDVVKIAPRGELDLVTTGQLKRELERVIDAGPSRIVIDLRGVEFLDSTALHILLDAHTQAQHDDWALTIIPGPRPVQRIFEVTRTIDRLPFATANGPAACL